MMRTQILSIAFVLLLAGCPASGELGSTDLAPPPPRPETPALDEEADWWSDDEARDDDDSAHTNDDLDEDGSITEDDCDDTDPTIYPGAPEIPDDGIDQNCSGTDTVGCYLDMDSDDFGGLLAYYEADGVCQPGTTTDDTDCNDEDDTINPDEEDICDIIDQDCDGDALEDFTDTDGDGAPDCVDPPGSDTDGDGYSSEAGDCNDADPAISPGEAEVPDDGIDQDCNGADSVSCYLDNDGDGYGDSLAYYDADGACTTATTAIGDDCDDADPDVNPGAEEICDDIDQDCDGDFVEEWTDADVDSLPECATDPDEDGDGYAPSEGDCDDFDPLINPGETDYCNPFDEDCDGDIVENHPDNDGDGIPECDPAVDDDGDGFAELDGDCDDGDAEINPDAVDVGGDGIDQDCNGFDAINCYQDHDTDGWGGAVDYIEPLGNGCQDPTIMLGGDCDDGDHIVNPNAFEQCDLIDQNCDGDLVSPYWDDVDGDGIPECPDPDDNDGDGFNEEDADCDDSNPLIFPGAAEVTDDGVDQDCNGFDSVSCFFDDDGDGFGGPMLAYYEGGSDVCNPDTVLNNSDCNDTDPDTYIGAPDICDATDQDCDGDLVETHPDPDGDGIPDCPEDYDDDLDGLSESHGDCDDADPTIYLGAPEIVGDGIDQDCNGFDQIACYLDTDGDGYGTVLAYNEGDGPPCAAGTAAEADDCEGDDSNINPSMPDICDDIDQDCDGDIIENFTDADGDGEPDCLPPSGDGDGDGFSVPDGDCDDSDPDTYPGGTEVCDDQDQDCDGDVVEGWPDADGNGIPECN